MSNQTIVLAGGAGFLGTSAADYFKGIGYKIIVLTRGSEKVIDGIQYINWDARTEGSWTMYLEQAEALINFTGKSVNCIYNDANKAEIISSRVDSVRILSTAIKNCNTPPKVFIQAASLAIYGDTTAICDENAPYGNGFSVEVCKRWEAEFNNQELPHTRKVVLRIGFALGKNGGALEPLAKLAKFYLGGTIGSGSQYISWFHIEDLNRMFAFAIENESIEGTYNATGLKACTNKDFMSTLRKVMNVPFGLPAPSFIVKIGARLIMQADASLALTGRNCIPQKFLNQGFQLKHTDLSESLKEILH